MRFRLFILTFCIVLLGCLSTVTATSEPDIQIEVQLDRDTISMDDQATMIVKISGPTQNLPSPQLTTMPAFEIYSQGRSTNLSIVNGVVTASNTYRYLMIPKKAGSFPIDQVSVIYNNKRYVGNPVQMTVLNKGVATPEQLKNDSKNKDGRSKDYFLESSVDNKSPYVGQQVTLTLKFYIAVQYYGSPELAEPSTTGFWTEVLGNKAPYFQTIQGRRYKVIERKYAIFPTQTGDLTIGQAVIRATVADRSKRHRDPFSVLGDMFGRGVEISTRSKAIRVNVNALPLKGKPKDFSGTIGQFKIQAAADKRTVELNQPVTLSVRIAGTGNIKSVAEPKIPKMDEFRIFRASTSESMSRINDKIGGTKLFEEVFVPRRPGNLEIPSLAYNYFDPVKKKYLRVKTRPIKLTVTKPEGYVADPNLPYGTADLTIGSSSNDIRYIKTDIGQTQAVGDILLFKPFYVLVNGLPLLGLLGTILVRRHREKLAGNVGLARSRAASAMAKKRLSKARSLVNEGNAEPFFAEISTALTAYIADKLNISPHGLTMDKISSMLREQGAEEEMILSVNSLLKKSDFARFAASTVSLADMTEALARSETIMVQLEGVKFA